MPNLQNATCQALELIRAGLWLLADKNGKLLPATLELAGFAMPK